MKNMKVYLVTNRDSEIWFVSYVDCKMVVVAEDELHAERCARCNSNDFKRAKKIEVKEIDLYEEGVILVTQT